MKTSRKALGLILLCMCMVLMGACHRHGPFRPHHPCKKSWHDRFHQRGIERILGKLDKGMEELNLNDSQQEKYEALRSRFKEDLSGMGQDRTAFFIDVKTEIDREAPDMVKLAGLLQQRLEMMEDRLGAHIDAWVEFYQMLDDDQKAKVIEALRDRFEDCDHL